MTGRSFHRRQRALLALAVGAVLFGGCAQDNTRDLHQYVKQVESRQHPRVKPLPQFEPFDTYSYTDKNMRSPFTPTTFSSQSTNKGPSTGNGIHPDPNRPREPLEEFPLDSLRMVGTLARKGHTWALVQDSTGTIHRVRPGNHLGQNNGKITQISESNIKLVEIVPDGMGGWRKRKASLALQE